MIKKVLILSMSLVFLFSSCATMLNGKYQKIEIKKVSSSDKILIDGKAPKIKDNKYLFERNQAPKQITIQSEGFKDKNIAIMQYKKSPLFILSIIPFGLVFMLPPVLDVGEHSWDYDKTPITYTKTPSVEKRKADQKNITVNKVSVDLDEKNMKYRYFYSYKTYKYTKNSTMAQRSNYSGDKIKIEDTQFSSSLNEVLKDKGYIDTSHTVLKNSYLNKLSVNANIKEYTINQVDNNIDLVMTSKQTQPNAYIFNSRLGGLIYLDVSITWEILDYYDKPIFTTETNCRSDQFAIKSYKKDSEEVIDKALKDVMEASLAKFINSEKTKEYLNDTSTTDFEKSFEVINIHDSESHVSDLSQAIASSVTIKVQEGHGSGFFISKDGYIITNYHVVADTGEIKVVLNDKSIHNAKIERISKIYDLALLKIDTDKEFIPFKISTDKDIKVATEVYAIGTPTGEDLSQTLSKGIISGIRDRNDSRLIQTDASVNGGNSGGPMVTKDGTVIGVVSSKLKGFGIEGVGFGIPAYEIIDRLKLVIQ